MSYIKVSEKDLAIQSQAACISKTIYTFSWIQRGHAMQRMFTVCVSAVCMYALYALAVPQARFCSQWGKGRETDRD